MQLDKMTNKQLEMVKQVTGKTEEEINKAMNYGDMIVFDSAESVFDWIHFDENASASDIQYALSDLLYSKVKQNEVGKTLPEIFVESDDRMLVDKDSGNVIFLYD